MWRRRLVRAKCKDTPEVVEQMAGELKENKRKLKKAIGIAKKKSWDELLEGLNADPWGRPYKKIMNRVKADNINVCGKLPVKKVDEILRKLFPNDRGINVYRESRNDTEEWVPEVTEEELNIVIRRATKKENKAPGPDGVQAKWMAEAQRSAETVYRGLYDGCLRTGKFPRRWKVAKIVLLKKEGKPDGEASSYRPLCLLNEEGMMLEGIIKNRIEEHMREGGDELSNNQFGFRRGR